LYLRSFKLENALCLWYIDSGADPWDEWHGTTVDDEFADAMDRVGTHLICLGDKGDTKLGAARIQSTDANWRDVVGLLMRNAQGIIVMPAHTDSLVEEIQTIFNAPYLISKTAFLMMPKGSLNAPGLLWDRLTGQLSAIGISLPAYDPRGQIFNAFGFSSPIIGTVSNSPAFTGLVIDAIQHAKGSSHSDPTSRVNGWEMAGGLFKDAR